MRFIFSDSQDVYFNLAAEAYLLHEQEEDVIVIWRSHNAVVCGKHQNACAEANYAYCTLNDIAIARRLSGGGTVFHDLGNINFSFIKKLDQGMERAVDYKRYLEPIRKVLERLGIYTTYSTRDDLLLNGLKISGNAQHIYQKGLKGLHHGTLLYDANLSALGKSIHSDGTYKGKSVPSNRSEVTNIRDWHDFGDTESFLNLFLAEIAHFFEIPMETWTPDEKSRCLEISQEKFSQESWILGYSPRYSHQRKLSWTVGTFDLQMQVYQDVVEEMQLTDTSGNAVFVSECAALMGGPLRLNRLQGRFEGVSDTELLDLF